MSVESPPKWASDAFARLLELEREATHIRQNQPLFVPGLLQTEDYATALIAGVMCLSPDAPEVTERVQLRMRRSAAFLERLDGAAPPKLTTVIDEPVLRRRVGGSATLRRQLDHLLELTARYPSIHLAIPALDGEAHPGLGGSFELVDHDGAGRTAFFEAPGYDRITDDPDLVQRYGRRFEVLLTAASAGEKASERLERLSATIV